MLISPDLQLSVCTLRPKVEVHKHTQTLPADKLLDSQQLGGGGGGGFLSSYSTASNVSFQVPFLLLLVYMLKSADAHTRCLTCPSFLFL